MTFSFSDHKVITIEKLKQLNIVVAFEEKQTPAFDENALYQKLSKYSEKLY